MRSKSAQFRGSQGGQRPCVAARKGRTYDRTIPMCEDRLKTLLPRGPFHMWTGWDIPPLERLRKGYWHQLLPTAKEQRRHRRNRDTSSNNGARSRNGPPRSNAEHLYWEVNFMLFAKYDCQALLFRFDIVHRPADRRARGGDGRGWPGAHLPWHARVAAHRLSLRPPVHPSDKSSSQQAPSTCGREKIFPIFSGDLF